MMPTKLAARRREMRAEVIGAIACCALMAVAVTFTGYMAIRAAIAMPITLSQDVESF